VAIVSSWREEGIARARDDVEREEHRLRRLRTKDDLLDEMAEQVASGELTVRQATEDERVRYGIRPAAEEFCKTAAEGDELAAITNLQSPNLSATQRAAREVAVAAAGAAAAELAAGAGVSLRTVERALRVKEADPELFQKLAEGRVSATRADKEIAR
jgi:hypothetical protein